MTVLMTSLPEQLQVKRTDPRPQVLLPLAGPTDPAAIDLAVQVAKDEGAMLVATYLTLVPRHLHADSPRHDPSRLATPLFEAVEWAALPAGVAVTTRIATGRTLCHALDRLWAAESFVCVVATVPAEGQRGFSGRDIAWLVAHTPSAALVVKPTPGLAAGEGAELPGAPAVSTILD